MQQQTDLENLYENTHKASSQNATKAMNSTYNLSLMWQEKDRCNK